MPRRYGQWAGALLFVVVSVVVAAWVWQQRSDRVEVIVAGVAVPVGEVVDREDLRAVEVAGLDGALDVGEVESVVGQTAAVALVPGQVLTRDMLTSAPVPAAGERVVGMEMEATRVPSGLAPGDRVTVLAVPPSGDPGAVSELLDPAVLAEAVLVRDVTVAEGALTRLSLVVGEDAAERVGAFAATGRVALIQAPFSEAASVGDAAADGELEGTTDDSVSSGSTADGAKERADDTREAVGGGR